MYNASQHRSAKRASAERLASAAAPAQLSPLSSRHRTVGASRVRLGADAVATGPADPMMHDGLLTLGNVQRELALELGPPARVATSTAVLRSIRPALSRSAPVVVGTGSCPVPTAVDFLRPYMEGGGDQADAHDDHRYA